HDYEKENTINESTNEENMISEMISNDEKENLINETASENENIISENDKYERQIKKSKLCHSRWHTTTSCSKNEKKLDKYWDELKATFYETAILDPNNKLMPFEHEDINKAQKMIYETYRTYYAIKNKIVKSLPKLESSLSKLGSSRDYFQHYLKRSYNMFVDDDNALKEYLNLPIEEATSVASEQMFSIAKFTISPTRCCLDSEKARASLCLKTWILTVFDILGDAIFGKNGVRSKIVIRFPEPKFIEYRSF
ncbi:11203_t:CDS:2, partial [Cetraspora pellucida]